MVTSVPPSVAQIDIEPSMPARITALLENHRAQLEEYASLLLSFNEHLNLISRRDTVNVFDHHILHSLALTARRFDHGSIVVDWGSGGGLPAIPLAIVQPDVQFIAVDTIEKKTRALKSIRTRLHLENLDVWNGRAEEWGGQCDYSVSRATASLSNLWFWHIRSSSPPESAEASVWEKGLLCLKGGDLKSEIFELERDFPDVSIDAFDLAGLLGRTYFDSKALIHVH